MHVRRDETAQITVHLGHKPRQRERTRRRKKIRSRTREKDRPDMRHVVRQGKRRSVRQEGDGHIAGARDASDSIMRKFMQENGEEGDQIRKKAAEKRGDQKKSEEERVDAKSQRTKEKRLAGTVSERSPLQIAAATRYTTAPKIAEKYKKAKGLSFPRRITTFLFSYPFPQNRPSLIV